MGDDMAANQDSGLAAMPASGRGPRARWRHHKATRPHSTIRILRALTRLRLYRPVMRILHRSGQCFMTTHHMEDGILRRCCWCGHSYRPYDPAAAETSLRNAAADQAEVPDPEDIAGHTHPEA